MTSFQHNTGSRWTDRQTPFDSKYHAYRADKKNNARQLLRYSRQP